MTRTAARELAVRLCYGLAENPRDPEEALNEFFDGEYYATLSKEDELYESEPDERQTEYIRRLVKGTADHGAELDGYIENKKQQVEEAYQRWQEKQQEGDDQKHEAEDKAAHDPEKAMKMNLDDLEGNVF